MRSRRMQRVLVGLMSVVAFAGCNPLTAMYFLLGAPENKLPAEFPLVAEKKKEPKLLVLFSTPVEMPVDFIGSDRMLTSEFVQALTLGLQSNKEKVKVIPSREIDKYKESHPNWRSRNPQEIAEDFGADFVVNFELQEMRLFMPGSRRQILQGYTRITGRAYNLSNPESEPRELQEYTLEYPRGTVVQVEGNDGSISKFRQQFIRQIAVELSWKFTAHQLREKLAGGNRLIE